ncbi:D-3-phosphoglycerate dehydrogenase OS=Streptomyces antimycoticus OX=68175 GN=SANT12839_084190 PE=3 SV=1 [Streptomyces antimycoticus]
MTAAVLDAAPALTVVAKHGVGTDNRRPRPAHGVRVVNAPGSNTTAVADMTMALLLAAVRRSCPRTPSPPVLDPLLRAELAGRTLGIVGFGRIGQAVARRARALDRPGLRPHLPAAVWPSRGYRP